jgi:hypothetical protein
VACVCTAANLLKERYDGILAHCKVEVTWYQHQCKICTGLLRKACLCDHIPGALSATAQCNREIRTASIDGDFASEAD